MKRLKGKIALITGAAGGMGAADAVLFARQGATVILTDVQDEMGEETARGIVASPDTAGSGGSAVYRRLDVTSEPDWVETVAWVESEYGRIDVWSTTQAPSAAVWAGCPTTPWRTGIGSSP